MSKYKQLKEAAAALESAASILEKQAAAADNLTKKAAAQPQAKPEVKTAAEKVKLGQQAKVAAAKLLEVGLLSNQKQADVFASQLLDHGQAIQKIAQLTQHVTATKMGRVVIDETKTKTAETATEVYDARARAVLSKLNLKA
jgi:hypothetical protein